jgi:hypothetical protein
MTLFGKTQGYRLLTRSWPRSFVAPDEMATYLGQNSPGASLFYNALNQGADGPRSLGSSHFEKGDKMLENIAIPMLVNTPPPSLYCGATCFRAMFTF